jgi:MFS family permease
VSTRLPAPDTFDQNERNVLVFTGIAHSATHFAELLYPTLAVVIARESGIPLERVLAWSFPSYLLFGLGALPAGYLADRFGCRGLILAAFAAMSLATVSAGFAAPGPALAACLGLLGLSASVYHPAGMGLISRSVAARGRALGVNGIFGNIGIALTPILTAALAAAVGWRGTLITSGAFLFALTLWFLRLPIREPPREKPASSPGIPRAAARAPWLPFAVICVTAMLGGISYRGNTLAQPAYFAEQVSAIGYGTATSLALLLGIAGQYWGGMVADRHDLRWSYLAFHLASLPALVLMMMTTNLPLVGVAGLFTFFSLGMQPIENSLFAAFTPDRWRSTGYGVKFVFTFGVGSTAVWLVSWVDGTLGLSRVFGALAIVVALLVAAAGVLIATTDPMSPGRRASRASV